MSNFEPLHARRRSQRGASEIAQFMPAIYILFLIIFLPLINLGCVFVTAAVQYLATNDFVSKAATQTDYGRALNSMTAEAYQFQSTGLSKFVNMMPQGGYVGCGDDLFVICTEIASGSATTSNANVPLTKAIDTKKYMYELSVKSDYTVDPLINLSQVPLIGEVPGLGQPVTLTFSANRPVEHPAGFQGNGSENENAHNFKNFKRIRNGALAPPPPSSITWRDPSIYQQIQAAGQTVVTQNVFVVKAINGAWTSSGVTVQPGQQIWIDTQAIGQWTVSANPSTSVSLTDANGFPFPASNNTNPTLHTSSLDGKVGASGTPFMVGDTLTNYELGGGGPISMIMNDVPGMYDDNSGEQQVRIIITN